MRASRFICDEHLGRLAKWLRILGLDTRYECPIEDARLIRLAQQERRFLLTRDHHLVKKTSRPNVVLIESTQYLKQLRELKEKIHLRPGRFFSRCLKCNKAIQYIAKAKVQRRVAKGVFAAYRRFYRCPSCKQIFWRGTHVQHSVEKIHRLLGRRKKTCAA